MKVIGITGSSGSGKSTVSKIVAKELNANLIVADEVVRKMQQPGCDYYKEIVNLVGTDYLYKDGKINRKKLGNAIFQDETIRKKINSLTNKYVVQEIKNQIENSKQEYVVIDVPLLLESGLNKQCNLVIGVIARRNIKVARICNRDNVKKETAKARLKIQPKNSFYKKNIRIIIKNNGGDYDKLVGRVRKMLQKL